MGEDIYDVIVIGGGPAGLSAAQYAARAGLKTVVLDRSPSAGALAYTSKIENYPGLTEPVSGTELLRRFRNQAEKFGAEYVQAQVVGVDFGKDIKEVSSVEGVYRGKAVIIATGAMGRKPSIPGEEQYLGRGVSYCATCDGAFYRGLSVCVLGESDEALEEAGVLLKFVDRLYLIAPSAGFEIPADNPLSSDGKVELIAGARVVSIEGGDLVEKVRIRRSEDGSEKELSVDGVFIYLQGSRPVTDFLGPDFPVGEKKCVMIHRTTETSVPGVYAAGDVTCSEVRQVVVAAAFGCMAALAAEKYINRRKRMRSDWAKDGGK
jgi:thioredoxin reductase (NADPH)